MNRYARQTILPELGETGQERLRQSHALVIGAGGLGSVALPLLAGAGTGQITIVDPDVVSRSNLHRQHLYAEDDCGAPKAQTAAKRCAALNSEIALTAINERLSPANVDALIDLADIVLDCADSHAVSYILSDHCHAKAKPLISASVLGFGGYVGGFCSTAPSLRAVFPDAPGNAANCETAGVMGPSVTTLGAIQAQMALNTLIGTVPSPLGQVMQLDLKSYRTSGFRFDEAREPEDGFRFTARSALHTDDRIIDLRPEAEAPTPIHPNALRLGADGIPAVLPATDRRLALACATGLRAWRAAQDIHHIWPGEIVLVAACAS